MDAKDFNKMLYIISTDKGIILANQELNSIGNRLKLKYLTSTIYLETRAGIIWYNNINRVMAQRNIDQKVLHIKGIYNDIQRLT